MIRKIKLNPYRVGAIVRWSDSFLLDPNHRWHPMRMKIVRTVRDDLDVEVVKACEDGGRAPKGGVLTYHPKRWFTPVED